MRKTAPGACEQLIQLWPHLDDRVRRMVAAAEALRLGRGGVTQVSQACGLSHVTITKGIAELNEAPLPQGRIRRAGAGRPRLEVRDPSLNEALDALVEPLARGDPMSPLRWTCKSTRSLAATLAEKGHPVSHEKVAQVLREMNYSLQSNRKMEEGEDHPDRDAQFRYINKQVRKAIRQGDPVISVDTKKKELVGNFENNRIAHSPQTANSESCLALLKTIIAELKRLAAHEPHEMVAQVRAFVHAHISEPFALEDLSAISGLSKFHFVRHYREITGRTPMQDARYLRLEEARRLILSTSLPLYEIAPMVGIPDECRLSRLLKSSLWISARELRQPGRPGSAHAQVHPD